MDQVTINQILMGLAILYSVVWLAIGFSTGVMRTGRGVILRTGDPKGFWTQMALRGSVGVVAAYLLYAGV